MRIVKGNKILELSKKELEKIVLEYDQTIIDIGTGDGRYVYKSALEDQNTLFIGIDPSARQLQIFSRKAQRKKLKNVLFVVGSAELLPRDLENTADKVMVILPWGSLLEAVVKPELKTFKNITNLLKPKSELQIIFGYDPDLEPSETHRLDLLSITREYIEGNIISQIKAYNLHVRGLLKVTAEELRTFETTWSKKLALTEDRPLFMLTIEKSD